MCTKATFTKKVRNLTESSENEVNGVPWHITEKKISELAESQFDLENVQSELNEFGWT